VQSFFTVKTKFLFTGSGSKIVVTVLQATVTGGTPMSMLGRVAEVDIGPNDSTAKRLKTSDIAKNLEMLIRT
jgi:hypothetical protein